LGRIFERAEQYLDQLTTDAEFVEIGTSRNGDDGSTRIIAGWASRYSARLTTVDFDPDNCEFVRQLNLPNVDIVNARGEDWLYTKIYNPLHPVSFLYLDNFDWDWHPEKTEDFILEQQLKYKTLGIEMTNVNSQRAHLAQAMMAVHHMAPHSIIVCDDTWYNKWWGHYSGKSGSAIPFLLNNGFDVLETEEDPVYGTILGRGIV
jgi:hypothetical protein